MIVTRLAIDRIIGAALILSLSGATAPAAEPDALIGLWDQIASDAGACPACTIEIHRTAGGLVVSANNGWSAHLDPAGDGLAGPGRWAPSIPGPYAGHRFAATLHRVDDHLHLSMVLGSGAPRRIVRGVYRQRGWAGV